MLSLLMLWWLGQTLGAPVWFWVLWWINVVIVVARFAWDMYKAGRGS